MKIVTTLICGFFLSVNLTLYGQVVIENINFDTYINPTNNDLHNHFYNNFTVTQIQTNGITGGCLAAPDSNNFGNDNAIYCSKYRGDTGTTYLTSVCFKYDTTIINPNGYERPVSLFFNPTADWNHYLIATVEKTKKIGLITYGSSNPSSPFLPLQHDYWYKFLVSMDFIGGASNDQINVVANAYDLGPSGTNIPNLIGTVSGTFHDSILIADSAISIGINGARRGGTIYLDNFHYEGVKSSEGCLITGIHEEGNQSFIKIYPNPLTSSSTLQLNTQVKDAEVVIYDVLGKEIMSRKMDGDKMEIEKANLENGVYFVAVTSKESRWVEKLVVE